MNCIVIAFASAIVCVANLPFLIDWSELIVGLPLTLFALASRVRVISGFYLGAVFACYVAGERIGGELPAGLEGKDLRVTGVVADLPRESGVASRFRFRVTRSIGEDFHGDVLISCYRCERRFVPGDVVQATLRLNRPRGTLNPDLFDYEGWLFTKNLKGTGYIREVDTLVSLGQNPFVGIHHRYRQQLGDLIRSELPQGMMTGLLRALTIGDSTAIGSDAWQTLSKTGTNHLFVISGLHVGMVASLIYKLLSLLAFPATSRSVATLVATGAYAAVAGWGLPVQRAFVMTAVVVVGTSLQRNISVATMFCSALFTVLIIEPFAVLNIGFWLSFAAVFSLLYAFSGRVPLVSSWIVSSIRSQCVVYIGMLPWMLYLLHQLSWLSWIVNLAAIPWIGLLVVPLVLLTIILSLFSISIASLGLTLCSELLQLAWAGIDWVARWNFVYYGEPPTLMQMLIAIIGVLALLAPRGLLPRWVALVCLIPLFSVPASLLPRLEISFIDVGQGLSVLVRTANQTLLYDAGPANPSFDAGQQIVTPYLRSKDIDVVDYLIVSHGDNDHSGGVGAIRENFQVEKVFVSQGSVLPGSRECDHFEWQSDGLRFSLFSMYLLSMYEGNDANNASCLLQITGPGIDVLLTGDIEAVAEGKLVQLPLPTMDLISAPHHGSASSSTPGLLNKLQPDLVVVSAGYNNRFGHPNDEVVERYELRHSRLLNTAEHGAITISFAQAKELSLARETEKRFWH